jgi:methylated-DNA-[protein]-cysteine S-methyltransferase
MPSEENQFKRRVLLTVRRIPVGRVATYGDIAELAGRPRAWRAVGTIMRNCRVLGVPCHRVVAAGGCLGGYSDLFLKRELLRAEGIRVVGNRLRNFGGIRWPGCR